MPWCRAAANIDVHHILWRVNGGGNDPENLTCLCAGHHAAHHRGELLIDGKAPALTFRRRSEVPHVGDRRDRSREVSPRVEVRETTLALTGLGFTKAEAQRALTAAQAQVPPDSGVEPLLRAALRELR